MRSTLLLLLVVLVGCPADEDPPPPDDDDADEAVPWTADLPLLADDIAHPRGFLPLRSILHLHSAVSHDACDGAGYVEGVLDQECLDQLRDGLCRTTIDLAYLSDHPAYAAFFEFEELVLLLDGAEPIQDGGDTIAARIICDDGHEVVWMVGIEDELMPLGLDRHAAPVGKEADELYNSSGPELFAAVEAAGGMVFQEHPEERDFTLLEERQDMGLVGLEVFQLHAILDPTAREEIYGLEPFGWIGDIEPFTHPDATGEPDLLFLAFHQELGPNVDRWEHLAARGPMVGIAATDAHRNVLPMILRDGERPDGYRRNFRWFSNVLLTEGKDPAAADAALAAGRLSMQFEIMGTPDGLAFWYEAPSGAAVEMGGRCTLCAGGTLHLTCPTLSPASPRDGEGTPEITVEVYRDGVVWQQECGSWTVDQPGRYRARIDMVPHHLVGFLGDADPAPYLQPFPWVYTNFITVE